MLDTMIPQILTTSGIAGVIAYITVKAMTKQVENQTKFLQDLSLEQINKLLEKQGETIDKLNQLTVNIDKLIQRIDYVINIQSRHIIFEPQTTTRIDKGEQEWLKKDPTRY